MIAPIAAPLPPPMIAPKTAPPMARISVSFGLLADSTLPSSSIDFTQRAEAGFVAAIGFLIERLSLVFAPHPIGEIVLPRVVAVGIPRSVAVLVRYPELNAVTRLLPRRYAGIQRQRQPEQ